MKERESIFKSTPQQKDGARKRLKERKVLSDSYDKEYYKHMMDQFKLFEDTRLGGELIGR